MTEVAANSPDLQKRIQQIWIPLFTPLPPKKGKTVEEAKADFRKAVKINLGKTKVHVDKIRKKGGKVIFLVCPPPVSYAKWKIPSHRDNIFGIGYSKQQVRRESILRTTQSLNILIAQNGRISTEMMLVSSPNG